MTLQDVLSEIGTKVVDTARKNLKKRTVHGWKHKIMADSIASGNLYRSLKYVILNKNELDIHYADYGYWVDQGRKPGDVSDSGMVGLALWMKKKGIDMSLLYVIRRGIANKGFRGTKFLTKALEAEAGNIDKAIDEYVNDLVDAGLKID